MSTMFVDTCQSGKYVRHLRRASYREDGRVRHRTIANLSHCSEAELKALKWALKHKQQLDEILERHGGPESPERIGLRLARALSDSRQGKLARWQVLARVLDQGSRLSAVRPKSSMSI